MFTVLSSINHGDWTTSKWLDRQGFIGFCKLMGANSNAINSFDKTGNIAFIDKDDDTHYSFRLTKASHKELK